MYHPLLFAMIDETTLEGAALEGARWIIRRRSELDEADLRGGSF